MAHHPDEFQGIAVLPLPTEAPFPEDAIIGKRLNEESRAMRVGFFIGI